MSPAIKCPKCGAEVSSEYNFCPHCRTSIKARDGVVSESSTEEDVRPISQQNAPEQIRFFLGELNTSERHFIYAFFLSSALGFVLGLFVTAVYPIASMPFQMAVVSKPHFTHAISLFSHNLLVAIVSALTGGIGGLFSNFITFALVAITLNSRVSLVGAIFLLFAYCMFEPLELGGCLCFAIVGYTGLEKLVWKRKTRLRVGRFLILGTALLFIAAVIEWSLVVFVVTIRLFIGHSF